MSATTDRFAQIKTFIFDIDGVCTDGRVYLPESGDTFRTFNIKDSFAIAHALKAGYRVGIVSSANSEGVRKWLTTLGVKDIFMGGPDDQKLNAYLGYISRDKLNESEIVYMGDDLPDLPILKRGLLSTCPADASSELTDICEYISPRNGGQGAVRDIIEQVMRTQSTWTS
jgi:3-deoxy-D-manno-octulosonate 8-phosphate phosphatase (KDO 8-P phosphatase)